MFRSGGARERARGGREMFDFSLFLFKHIYLREIESKYYLASSLLYFPKPGRCCASILFTQSWIRSDFSGHLFVTHHVENCFRSASAYVHNVNVSSSFVPATKASLGLPQLDYERMKNDDGGVNQKFPSEASRKIALRTIRHIYFEI